MAITKRLAELMQGVIVVNSEVGKGTIFTTTLRLMRHESEPESEIDEQWHNPRTLIVSQDQDQIRMLESCLATWKIAAETIATPEITNTTVLHQLNRAAKAGNSYGLVIVDEASAKIEVLKFVCSVRMEPGCDKLKLILLTTEKNQIFSRLAIEAGFNRTITTPFQQSLLFNYLSDLLSLDQSITTELWETQAALDLQNNDTPQLLLVVEDHENNQKVALARLRHLGYTAHVVANGVDAVNAIAKASDLYKLVLMDWQMPIMDGIKATQTIRTLEAGSERHIPIIGMTANAMKGDREKCLDAGMDDYISKPVSLPDLRRILELWTTAR